MDIKKELENKRKEITQLFKAEFIGKNGFPVFSIDSATGKHTDKSSSLPELGDYLPFLLYYGEKEFTKTQIKLVKKHFSEKKFIWNMHTRLPKHSWAFEYSDLILGLLLCYEISKNKECIRLAEDILNFVLKVFYKKGFICSHHFASINYTLPITSAICGIYVELLTDFYRITKKKKYVTLAEKLMKKMIGMKGFQKYGVFPTYYPIHALIRFFLSPVKLTKRFDATKYNTHTSHALVSLYEITKKETYLENYKKWLKGMNAHLMYKEGGYAQIAYIGKKTIRKRLEITNFHVLESLCDMYWLSKEKIFLEEAEKLADFWLKKQGKTGLLPFKYKEKTSLLDGETDFFVGLAKLWELSGKEFYRKKAMEIINGILNNHKAKYGFCDAVDINSGRKVKSTIDTRFLTLFFKVDMLIENNLKSYNKRHLYSLLRDR